MPSSVLFEFLVTANGSIDLLTPYESNCCHKLTLVAWLCCKDAYIDPSPVDLYCFWTSLQVISYSLSFLIPTTIHGSDFSLTHFHNWSKANKNAEKQLLPVIPFVIKNVHYLPWCIYIILYIIQVAIPITILETPHLTKVVAVSIGCLILLQRCLYWCQYCWSLLFLKFSWSNFILTLVSDSNINPWEWLYLDPLLQVEQG